MEKKTTKKAAAAVKTETKNPVAKAIKSQVSKAKSQRDGSKPTSEKNVKAAESKTVEVKKAPAGYFFGEIKLPRPLKHIHSEKWYEAHKYDSQWYECALDALDSLIEAEEYKLAAIASRHTIKELVAHLKKREKYMKKV